MAFPYADVAECVDFSDVELVSEVAVRHHVDGILAISSDRAVVPAAAVAEAVGLNGIGVAVAKAMTDKVTMRAQLAEAGISQPRHRVLTHESDLREAFNEVHGPAVLKPVDSGGQRGVFRVESADDVARHLAEALSFSRTGRALLEAFVPGTELNGLLVVRDGRPTLITLSDRLRPPGEGFGVGWIHSFPSALPEAALATARAAAARAVEALGLRDGIAFPQLIVPDGGSAVLIEIAARIAAGQMADLVRLATGINLFDVAFNQALGRAIPDALITPTFTRPVAIRFLTAQPGVLPVGTVTHIEGLDEVRRAPGVLDAALYFEPGATINPVRVDADRMGYVIATAETAEAALASANTASKLLVVETDKTAPRLVAARRIGRRRLRPLSIAVAFGLVAAALLAFVLSDRDKIQRALITGAHVTREFSPVCRCPLDVAHVAFRLLEPDRLTIEMINSAGRPVQTLVRDKLLSPGWKSLSWNGRTSHDVVARGGAYRPRLDFVTLHRTVELPAVNLRGADTNVDALRDHG